MQRLDLQAEVAQLRSDLSGMAKDYVLIQDRLDAADIKIAVAEHDLTALRTRLAGAQRAHPRDACAEVSCPLCAALYPRLRSVR